MFLEIILEEDEAETEEIPDAQPPRKRILRRWRTKVSIEEAQRQEITKISKMSEIQRKTAREVDPCKIVDPSKIIEIFGDSENSKNSENSEKAIPKLVKDRILQELMEVENAQTQNTQRVHKISRV